MESKPFVTSAEHFFYLPNLFLNHAPAVFGFASSLQIRIIRGLLRSHNHCIGD